MLFLFNLEVCSKTFNFAHYTLMNKLLVAANLSFQYHTYAILLENSKHLFTFKGKEHLMGDAGPQRVEHYTIIRLLNDSPISYTYLGKDELRKKRYVIFKIFNIPLSTTI